MSQHSRNEVGGCTCSYMILLPWTWSEDRLGERLTFVQGGEKHSVMLWRVSEGVQLATMYLHQPELQVLIDHKVKAHYLKEVLGVCRELSHGRLHDCLAVCQYLW